MTAHSHRGESGYAMLLVFLMSAMIAIALYRELPRVAFEAQRAKEQLLIERGEQYKRAIQLFVRKVNRYPATIEELESTNNIRFLRKRYVDPMTGKDKWRLIHINGGVLTDSIVQKNKPGQDQQKQANQNTFIGEGPVMGAANDPNQQQINPALRRRASDDRPIVTQEVAEQTQPDADQENPEPDNNADNNNAPDVIDTNDNTDNSNEENAAPEQPGVANANTPGMANPAMPAMPGRLPQPGMYQPGTNPQGAIQPGAYPQAQGAYQQGAFQPGLPSRQFNPGMAGRPYPMQGQMPSPGMNGGFQQPTATGDMSGSGSSGSVGVQPSLGQTSNYPGAQGAMPGMPGQPFPAQPQQAFPGQGQPGAFGQPNGGFGQPTGGFGRPGQMTSFGGAPGSPGIPIGQNGANPGVSMSTLGLDQARPGGMQGLPGMGGQQIGGGIAGVASESKGPGIIVYNERKKYNEWEFVYDQTKDRGLAGVQRGGGAPGTPAGQMGNMPPGMNPQQPGAGGFGQPGGFGQGPGGNTVSNGLFNPTGGFGQQPPQQPQPQPQQPPN